MALLACGLLAGCGGSAGHTTASASATPTAAPPAHAASYVAAGNAICAAQVARLARLPRPSTPEQTVTYLPPALAAMRHESTQLTALDPAGAAGAKLTAAISGTRALATLLTRFLRELRQGTVEFTQLASLQQRTTAMRKLLDARFRAAGLTSCAQ